MLYYAKSCTLSNFENNIIVKKNAKFEFWRIFYRRLFLSSIFGDIKEKPREMARGFLFLEKYPSSNIFENKKGANYKLMTKSQFSLNSNEYFSKKLQKSLVKNPPKFELCIFLYNNIVFKIR